MVHETPALLFAKVIEGTPTRSARRTAKQRIDPIAKSCELYAGSACELTQLTGSPTFDFRDVQNIEVGMQECLNTLSNRIATYDAKSPVDCGTPVTIPAEVVSSISVLSHENLKMRLATFGFALQAFVNKGTHYELQGRFLGEQDAPQDHKQIRDRIIDMLSRIAAVK